MDTLRQSAAQIGDIDANPAYPPHRALRHHRRSFHRVWPPSLEIKLARLSIDDGDAVTHLHGLAPGAAADPPWGQWAVKPTKTDMFMPQNSTDESMIQSAYGRLEQTSTMGPYPDASAASTDDLLLPPLKRAPSYSLSSSPHFSPLSSGQGLRDTTVLNQASEVDRISSPCIAVTNGIHFRHTTMEEDEYNTPITFKPSMENDAGGLHITMDPEITPHIHPLDGPSSIPLSADSHVVTTMLSTSAGMTIDFPLSSSLETTTNTPGIMMDLVVDEAEFGQDLFMRAPASRAASLIQPADIALVLSSGVPTPTDTEPASPAGILFWRKGSDVGGSLPRRPSAHRHFSVDALQDQQRHHTHHHDHSHNGYHHHRHRHSDTSALAPEGDRHHHRHSMYSALWGGTGDGSSDVSQQNKHHPREHHHSHHHHHREHRHENIEGRDAVSREQGVSDPMVLQEDFSSLTLCPPVPLQQPSGVSSPTAAGASSLPPITKGREVLGAPRSSDLATREDHSWRSMSMSTQSHYDDPRLDKIYGYYDTSNGSSRLNTITPPFHPLEVPPQAQVGRSLPDQPFSSFRTDNAPPRPMTPRRHLVDEQQVQVHHFLNVPWTGQGMPQQRHHSKLHSRIIAVPSAEQSSSSFDSSEPTGTRSSGGDDGIDGVAGETPTTQQSSSAPSFQSPIIVESEGTGTEAGQEAQSHMVAILQDPDWNSDVPLIEVHDELSLQQIRQLEDEERQDRMMMQEAAASALVVDTSDRHGGDGVHSSSRTTAATFTGSGEHPVWKKGEKHAHEEANLIKDALKRQN